MTETPREEDAERARIAPVLSVYKPRGLTRYGWRRQAGRRALPQE